MINPYDKYIVRLKNKKAARPEMEMYNRNLSTLSGTYQTFDRDMESSLRRSGASTAAKVAANNEAKKGFNNIQNQTYNQAVSEESKRQGRLDEMIAEADLKSTAWQEQQDLMKQERKNALIKTGFQIGGAAVGAGIGAMAGNPILGAQLGASGGQMLGSFVGGDGQMSTDNFNPEEFSMGLQDTISGISSAVTLGEQKAVLSDLSNELSDVQNLSAQDISMVIGFIQTGQVSAAAEMLRKRRANNPTLTADEMRDAELLSPYRR